MFALVSKVTRSPANVILGTIQVRCESEEDRKVHTPDEAVGGRSEAFGPLEVVGSDSFVQGVRAP